MAVNLNQNTDCCETTCTNTTVNTPGPQGATGASGSNGTNGTNGANGYSVTSGSFVMPAVGASTNVSVDQTGWIVATSSDDSQVVFIGNAGHFIAKGKGTNHITVQPLYYPGDPASEGDTISSGKVVAPAGIQGPAGSAASELSNQGDLLSHTGSALSPLSVGANNKVLKADSTAPTGLVWGDVATSEITGNIDLSSQVTGTLPVANVGNTGGATGDLLYWNGSNWVRLPAVAAGQVLLSQGTGAAPAYALPSSLSGVATYAAKGKFVATNTGSANTTTSWDVNIATAQLTDTAPSGMTVTFTDPVSVDLPVFAYEVPDATSGSVTGPKTTPAIVSNRTTGGLKISASTSGSTGTFVLYILNN
jgi:hypothetical protein